VALARTPWRLASRHGPEPTPFIARRSPVARPPAGRRTARRAHRTWRREDAARTVPGGSTRTKPRFAPYMGGKPRSRRATGGKRRSRRAPGGTSTDAPLIAGPLSATSIRSAPRRGTRRTVPSRGTRRTGACAPAAGRAERGACAHAAGRAEPGACAHAGGRVERERAPRDAPNAERSCGAPTGRAVRDRPRRWCRALHRGRRRWRLGSPRRRPPAGRRWRAPHTPAGPPRARRRSP
jgi:hypothetical protein